MIHGKIWIRFSITKGYTRQKIVLNHTGDFLWDYNWDAVWDGITYKNDTAWIAEMKVSTPSNLMEKNLILTLWDSTKVLG